MADCWRQHSIIYTGYFLLFSKQRHQKTGYIRDGHPSLTRGDLLQSHPTALLSSVPPNRSPQVHRGEGAALRAPPHPTGGRRSVVPNMNRQRCSHLPTLAHAQPWEQGQATPPPPAPVRAEQLQSTGWIQQQSSVTASSHLWLEIDPF